MLKQLIRKLIPATPVVLKNVYNIDKTKPKALVSYISKNVFKYDSEILHNNIIECRAICEVLDELGYQVDVVDYNIPTYSTNEYELIIGFGESLEIALKKRIETKPYIIAYYTGTNPLISNPNTIKRCIEAYNKTNRLFLSSIRFVDKVYPAQIINSDLMILLGNKCVKETYDGYGISKIETIDAPAVKLKADLISNKHYNTAKNNYLYFSGSGSIHKGLDLCIEAFADNKLRKQNLHICGPVEYEKEFWNYYSPIITKSENIHYYGFVSISNPVFTELLEKCAFIISPTVSEGQSTSIINAVANSGIIPVTTSIAGIPKSINVFYLDELCKEKIEQSVLSCSNLNDEEIKEKTSNNLEISHIFSLETFKGNIKKYIKSVLYKTYQ